MSQTITVYTNPECGPCIQLKKLLKKNEIEYIEKDIINNRKYAQEFLGLGLKYTPTTIIISGEEKFEVIGSNIQKIQRLLD